MTMINELFEGPTLEYLGEEENAIFETFCRIYHM